MHQMCLFLLESDVAAALTIQEMLSEVTYVDPKDLSEVRSTFRFVVIISPFFRYRPFVYTLHDAPR